MAESPVILRSQALQEIFTSGRPFDLDFVTADRKRGTGGQYIRVKKHMLLRDSLPEEKQPDVYQEKFTRRRASGNTDNKTFRIFNPAHRSAHITSVHNLLIQSLNGKRVVNG
jgi:hypothetical protein